MTALPRCPVIVAALPRELKALVRGWREHRLPARVFVYESDHAVAVCAGMGSARVALAVQAAIAHRPVSRLISAGLAGACDPSLRVGEIVRAGVVVDTRSGERYFSSAAKQVLATSPGIASVPEKRRLFASYAASAVDMEAATVARIAQGHGIPFLAVKAISDEATFELEALGRFATPDGQFREAAFAAYAALRPAMWSRLLQLARNSNRALEALTSELQAQLDPHRQERLSPL